MGRRRTTIYRVAKRARFVQLLHEVIRNADLTLEERGFWAWVMSFPDDWEFDSAWARRANPNPRTGRPMGEDRFDRIIKNLERAALARRTRERSRDGTFAPYEYEFFEKPAAEWAGSQGPAASAGHHPTENPAGRIMTPNSETNPLRSPSKLGDNPATALPDDWTLPEADRAWATAYAPAQAHRVDAEAEAFADRQRSGRRPARRANWSAA